MIIIARPMDRGRRICVSAVCWSSVDAPARSMVALAEHEPGTSRRTTRRTTPSLLLHHRVDPVQLPLEDFAHGAYCHLPPFAPCCRS